MIVRTVSTLLVLSSCAAPAAVAQIRASEAAVVSQTVDGTVITVRYARPQLRGRTPGPDGVVHMEHMWTPGANWATTLEVSRPVTLNGHAVPAGTYSVWAEPAAGEWTFHLHPNPRLYHTAAPKAAEMTLTFKVTPEQGNESVEALTWDFPAIRQDGVTLRLRWVKAVVPFDIAVEPGRKAIVLTAEQAAPYVGGWLMQFRNEVNEKSPEIRTEIVLSNGVLKAVMDMPSPMGIEFHPTGEPHTFLPAFTMDGKLFDVETATPVVFQVSGGKATRWGTLPVKGISDDSWMWGWRRP